MKKTLSTVFFSAALLSLSACGAKGIDLGKAPPPPERLVCEEWPDRPNLAPLETFTLAEDATFLVNREGSSFSIRLPAGTKFYLKPKTDQRDSMIAEYIVRDARGAWKSCFVNVKWNKAYHDADSR